MKETIDTDYKPYFILDINKNVIDCNNSFVNLTNYSEKDIIGKKLGSLCSLLKINSPSLLANVDNDRTYYIFTKHLKPVEVNICIKYFNNLTRYIFFEKHSSWLDEKFSFIKQIYSNSKVGIAIYSFNDLILLVSNQRYLNFFGKPNNKKSFCIGKHPKYVIANYIGSKLEKAVLNVMKTGRLFHCKKYKIPVSKSSDSYWDIMIDPINMDNQPKYILVISSNVTKRVESEKIIAEQSKIIHQQKNELNTILQNTTAGISIVDKLGNHIKVNSNPKHWYDLFATTDDEIDYSREYYDDDGNLIASGVLPVSFLFDKKNSSVNQILFKHGENKVYYLINWNPVFTKKGQFSMGIITTSDITCEAEKQNQLEKVMAMHEDFFSFIAHEFKTPITTINSTIQLLELVYKDQMTEKISHGIRTIKRNTYQQMRLVSNLLDITRAESGYLKIYKKNYDIVAMTNLIIESVQPFANSKNINVLFKSSISGMIIAVDDEKYERVILNIISNAIKFTPSNKNIYVDISCDINNVYIKVTDEGPGIPKEKMNVIFDRFGQVGSSYTRQGEGTGIGLCLVKLLLNAMNGDIKLDSIEGEGSTFTIILPNKEADANQIVKMPEFTDDHLIKALNIEFSNIYFN